MNRLGQWYWRILVVLILGGFTVGFCLGQVRGIYTHDYGRTGSFRLWGVRDDLHGIVCYSLVPDGAQVGAAISCVALGGK